MPEIQTKRIAVRWTFDRGIADWGFSGDLDMNPSRDRHRLTVDSASAVIEVVLDPESTQGADFDARPVAWGGATQPACMGVGKCRGGRRFLITDVNEQNGEHAFRVRVRYQGRLYVSPDPTILNTEPTYTITGVTSEPRAEPAAVRRLKAPARRAA